MLMNRVFMFKIINLQEFCPIPSWSRSFHHLWLVFFCFSPFLPRSASTITSHCLLIHSYCFLVGIVGAFFESFEVELLLLLLLSFYHSTAFLCMGIVPRFNLFPGDKVSLHSMLFQKRTQALQLATHPCSFLGKSEKEIVKAVKVVNASLKWRKLKNYLQTQTQMRNYQLLSSFLRQKQYPAYSKVQSFPLRISFFSLNNIIIFLMFIKNPDLNTDVMIFCHIYFFIKSPKLHIDTAMLQKGTRMFRSLLFQRIEYGLLNHNEMEKAKEKFFGDQERTLKLKIKFILKETKYTIVQGSKDLWQDAKWIIKLYKNKKSSEFTGYEMAVSWRIVLDILKFIPYSVLLAIPLAEVLIPVLVWIFPNAIPSFFLFDTAEDKRIEKFQIVQEQSYRILIDKLLEVLRELSKNEEQFTNYDEFKTDFFQVIDELNEKLNYSKFTSDELIEVLRFLGGEFITGTATINKVSNLFTMGIPRAIIKMSRYLYWKITKKTLDPYEDPFFIIGNFRIFKLNYFPLQYFKRKFLLFQINRKFRILKKQDQAFEKYGMDDIIGRDIKDFARERGLAALTCYDTLKNVLKNDWVKTTTHPKFENNNTKFWYSIMLYHFLSQTNKDLN